ncbi:TPA: hypothetical protein ACHB2C_004348 [Klebsiella variicola subsp. variicola]
MPRVDITCSELTASRRMKIARHITEWFSDNGSDPWHVIIHFNIDKPMEYFVSNIPLTLYDNESESSTSKNISWASIVCYIHPDRDHVYMHELSNEIKRTLNIPDSGHCVINFILTPPNTVFYLKSGKLISSEKYPTEDLDNEAHK